MEKLAELMCVKVSIDECRDRVIEGKCGNIHVDGDGGPGGYCVALLCGTARRLRRALEKVASFSRVGVVGDGEAVVYVGGDISRSDAVVLRSVLGVKKRRVLSSEQRERLAEVGRRSRFSSGTALNGG